MRESQELGLVVCLSIGLDRQAAQEAVAGLFNGKSLGANQIEFGNGLNMGIVQEMPIPLAPISLQEASRSGRSCRRRCRPRRRPMRYPSLFFKTHRALYCELLNEVRLRGDWDGWLDFLAGGIEASATQVALTLRPTTGTQ